MGILKKRNWILILLFFPFLLANKECRRPITWGDPYKKLVSTWYADHQDLEKGSKCSECHDDKRSDRKPPKSHNSHDIVWKREHGKYAQLKYGFRNQNICLLCHQESSCSTCHQLQEPEDHNQFWKLKGHGVMTGLDRGRCTACHISTEFCERCHQQTRPMDHNALWGSSQNLHCNGCHLPLNQGVSQRCGACHASTPSHNQAPVPPASVPLHQAGVNCRLCHTQTTHIDNGDECTTCHLLSR